MKAMAVADPWYGTGVVRADGRLIRANRVQETRTAAESKGEWDEFKLLAALPQGGAIEPMENPGCACVKI